MNAQEAQESVAHMTVSELIRKCPKGMPMKEAVGRAISRKRKQPATAPEGADYDEEEEAAMRSLVAHPRGLDGARGPGAGDGAASRPSARGDADEANVDGGVFAPQLRVIDGRVVIDEQSLEVTAGRPDTRLDEPALVIEGNISVTYGTYLNKTASEKWRPDETETFFRALAQYGTDFSLLEKIIPNRNRRQIKLKFKREERENPARVNDALTRRLPANAQELQRIVEQVQSARAERSSSTVPQTDDGDEGPPHAQALTAPEIPTTARLPSVLVSGAMSTPPFDEAASTTLQRARARSPPAEEVDTGGRVYVNEGDGADDERAEGERAAESGLEADEEADEELPVDDDDDGDFDYY
ncbi:hypothetical protein KFE25_000866 [Diacronema lutheri]|uniref:Myb-like domain-containing protein n=1 Tax=Diacronema lutheri TaxID=2081491 RepID=A0A8J5XTC0_DIALT|nr:hypothetical protein KFE25_000866 [Diacronema lutheri]